MIARFLLFIIQIYWWTLSPIIGQVCRFQPTCSRYTAACIKQFGAGRGSWLGFVRICKCQPLHPGGFDPPPDTFSFFAKSGSKSVSGDQASRMNLRCAPVGRAALPSGDLHG